MVDADRSSAIRSWHERPERRSPRTGSIASGPMRLPVDAEAAYARWFPRPAGSHRGRVDARVPGRPSGCLPCWRGPRRSAQLIVLLADPLPRFLAAYGRAVAAQSRGRWDERDAIGAVRSRAARRTACGPCSASFHANGAAAPGGGLPRRPGWTAGAHVPTPWALDRLAPRAATDEPPADTRATPATSCPTPIRRAVSERLRRRSRAAGRARARARSSASGRSHSG